jgi:hypothetical protein
MDGLVPRLFRRFRTAKPTGIGVSRFRLLKLYFVHFTHGNPKSPRSGRTTTKVYVRSASPSRVRKMKGDVCDAFDPEGRDLAVHCCALKA